MLLERVSRFEWSEGFRCRKEGDLVWSSETGSSWAAENEVGGARLGGGPSGENARRAPCSQRDAQSGTSTAQHRGRRCVLKPARDLTGYNFKFASLVLTIVCCRVQARVR
jgi:hypothetical protein